MAPVSGDAERDEAADFAERLAESGLTPVAPEVDEHVTSLDMAGLSLTVTFLDDELERFWTAPVDAPALRDAAEELGGSSRWSRAGSAGFAVGGVRVATRAELLQLEPVGIVPPVLLGDVVPLLAHGAGHGGLGAHIRGLGHRRFLRFLWVFLVAGAGLEPATQRL